MNGEQHNAPNEKKEKRLHENVATSHFLNIWRQSSYSDLSFVDSWWWLCESNTLSGDGHNNNEKVNQLKWAQEWMQAEPLWMHVCRCSLQTETQADFHMHCECNISVQAGVLKLAMNCTVQFVLMGQHQVFGRGANCHAEWSDWTTLCVLWKPWVTCHGLVLMLALAHAVLLWIVETLQEIGAQRSFKSPDCFELRFLVCCQAANSF